MQTKIHTGLITVFAMLILAIAGLYDLYRNGKAEQERLANNITAIVKDKAQQQELTVKELKQLYPKYDSLAKVLQIKTKNITNIIETKYHFRDTILSKIIVHSDSIKERKSFDVKERCYHISGFISKDTLFFDKREINDKLTTFIYRDWKHRYLFGLIRTSPYYSARIFSACMNDTVCVEQNIKIKDK